MNELSLIEEKSGDVTTKANSIQIATKSEYHAATNYLKDIKSLQKEIKSVFDPIINKAHQAHKEAIAQRDKYLNPVKDAEKIVKDKVSDYAAILERERRAEQQRREEEARKERDKALHEALEAQEAAEHLKAQGDDKNASEVQQEAMKMAEEAVEIKAAKVKEEKVEGVSFRDKFEIEIINASIVPSEWLIPDEKSILAFVKASKGTREIPGVKIIKSTTTSVRA